MSRVRSERSSSSTAPPGTRRRAARSAPYERSIIPRWYPVIDPRAIRADLKPDLAELLIKACAAANVDRFSTAAEMQLALRNVRAGL
jgi:hypothetical protein